MWAAKGMSKASYLLCTAPDAVIRFYMHACLTLLGPCMQVKARRLLLNATASSMRSYQEWCHEVKALQLLQAVCLWDVTCL